MKNAIAAVTRVLSLHRSSTLPTVLLVTAIALCVVGPAQATEGRDPRTENPVPTMDLTISEQEKQFVLANVYFVLVHEFAHVLIHDHDVPILGREEDAADTIATLAMIAMAQRDQDEDNPWIKALVATAIGWHMLWQREGTEFPEIPQYSRHALSGQRFFNVACLVYGSDPDRFADWPKAAGLPPERAEWCDYDYQLARKSMDRVIKGDLTPSRAAAGSEAPPIFISYDEPTTELSEKLLTMIRDIRMVERTAQYLRENLTLAGPISIRFLSCDGAAAVWVPDTRRLLVCYELMELYYTLSRDLALYVSPEGSSVTLPGKPAEE